MILQHHMKVFSQPALTDLIGEVNSIASFLHEGSDFFPGDLVLRYASLFHKITHLVLRQSPDLEFNVETFAVLILDML